MRFIVTFCTTGISAMQRPRNLMIYKKVRYYWARRRAANQLSTTQSGVLFFQALFNKLLDFFKFLRGQQISDAL